jgi:hypothetical protein
MQISYDLESTISFYELETILGCDHQKKSFKSVLKCFLSQLCRDAVRQANQQLYPLDKDMKPVGLSGNETAFWVGYGQSEWVAKDFTGIQITAIKHIESKVIYFVCNGRPFYSSEWQKSGECLDFKSQFNNLADGILESAQKLEQYFIDRRLAYEAAKNN